MALWEDDIAILLESFAHDATRCVEPGVNAVATYFLSVCGAALLLSWADGRVHERGVMAVQRWFVATFKQ